MSVKRTIGYVGPDPRKKVYHRPYGRLVGGTAIGIMRIGSSCVIYLPGNVSNASTYDFPVRYVFTEGTTQDNIHRGDPSVLPNLIATARQLESEGCRAIFASCGYFGHFQREVSEAVDVPVFLSSVMQLPFAFAGLSPKKKIGILCGDGANLNDHLFQACGVSKELQDRCIITGMEGLPEFKKIIDDKGEMDAEALEGEMIACAEDLLKKHPDIGALLLECTEMPPFAAAIQAATGLPVFDAITMIKYIHHVVEQKPYYGFM